MPFTIDYNPASRALRLAQRAGQGDDFRWRFSAEQALSQNAAQRAQQEFQQNLALAQLDDQRKQQQFQNQMASAAFNLRAAEAAQRNQSFQAAQRAAMNRVSVPQPPQQQANPFDQALQQAMVSGAISPQQASLARVNVAAGASPYSGFGSFEERVDKTRQRQLEIERQQINADLKRIQSQLGSPHVDPDDMPALQAQLQARIAAQRRNAAALQEAIVQQQPAEPQPYVPQQTGAASIAFSGGQEFQYGPQGVRQTAGPLDPSSEQARQLITPDNVVETARVRNMTPRQVVEILRRQGYDVPDME